MVCLSVILLYYGIACLWFYNTGFCNKKGALFVPDPVYWFLNVKSTLCAWDKSHLVIRCYLFYMLLDSLFPSLYCWSRCTNFCLEFLHLCFQRLLVCSFLVIFLSAFGIRINLASNNELGSISFSMCWESLYSTGFISSLNV